MTQGKPKGDQMIVVILLMYFAISVELGHQTKNWASFRWPVYAAMFVIDGVIAEMEKDSKVKK